MYFSYTIFSFPHRLLRYPPVAIPFSQRELKGVDGYMLIDVEPMAAIMDAQAHESVVERRSRRSASGHNKRAYLYMKTFKKGCERCGRVKKQSPREPSDSDV